MISTKLIMYCFIAGGIYLLLLNLALEFVVRKLDLLKGTSAAMLEDNSSGWFTLYFIMEFLFYVVIPSIGYSFLYLVLPFVGVKAGLAAAVFAFAMGAVPIIMGISVRIKLPVPYLLFHLLGYLLKLAGAMGIIGYLYAL